MTPTPDNPIVETASHSAAVGPSAAKSYLASSVIHLGAGAVLATVLYWIPAPQVRQYGSISLPAIHLEFADQVDPQPVELAAAPESPDVVVMPDESWIGTKRFVEESTVSEPPPPTTQVASAATMPPTTMQRSDPPDATPPAVRPPQRRVSRASTPTTEVALPRPPIEFVGRPCRYPVQARQQGWQGTVLLLVHIAADGRVEHVELDQSSGNPLADAEAVQTVRTWRAVPVHAGEQLRAMVVRQPIEFRLNR